MKQIFVELGTLLNATPEVVEAAISNEVETDALGLIKSFKEGNKIFSIKDYETHNSNLQSEYDKQLLQRAKESKLPSDVYGVIKGTVLEMDQKDIAKEFEIKSFSNRDDLVSQIKARSANTDSAKLLTEIDALKKVNVELDTKFKNLDSEYANKYTQKDLTELKTKVWDSLESRLGGTIEENKIRRNLLQNAFDNQHKFVREGEKNVVLIGDTTLINSLTRDPLTLEQVAEEFAGKSFKLVVPDEGGRGAGSPENEGVNKSLKGLDVSGFNKYCEANKILPNSAEMDKAYSDWTTANKV